MGSVRVTLCAGVVAAAALAASAPPAHATDPGNTSGNVSENVSVVPASPVPGTDIQVRAGGCGGKTGTAVSAAFVADARLTQLTGRSPGTLAGETRVRSSLDPGTYVVRITCDGREDKVTGTIKVGGEGKPTTGLRPPPGLAPPTDLRFPTDLGPPTDLRPPTGITLPTAKPSGIRPPVTGPTATEASPVAERPAGERPAGRQPSAPSSPIAPVRAGGGGAAAHLAAADPVGARGSADPANSMDDARHTGPGARHAVVGLVLAGVAAVAVVARGARRGRDRRTE
ncbi:hypothetical protein [Streptomyces sp. 11x1]|uniref:hypothetical protein n=1 Tax=Streptomyces sp. 11x1 TaxID=3038642 RepID=UPI00292CFD4A|nr:hypothetical protein [Streptomyces sp. 11x1]WNZ11205.1 hypothetical protein P8T65_29080 [Streptomyces sp. 11x1]